MLYRIQNLANGLFFAMAKDGTLTADFNSTLFNASNDLLGSYSYPVEFPLEPNRAIIQNAQYINTISTLRTLDVMLWLGPVAYKKAKLYFTVDQNRISAELYFDLALMVNQLKTLRLCDLVDPNINDQYNASSLTAFRAYMMTVAAAAPGTYPYVFFPYKNDGAYIDAAYKLVPLWRSSVGYGVGNQVTYNGRLYSCIVAAAAGQDPVNWLNTQIVNTPQKWEDITVYPDNYLPASKIINRWEIADDGSTGFVVDTSFPVQQTQAPAFYLTYVLYRVAAYFGYTLAGEWLKTDDAKRLVLFTNIPCPYTGQIPDYWAMMPAVLVTDFLKEVRTQFGVMVDFDPTTMVCTIESLLYMESSPDTLDLQHLQTISYRETAMQSQAFTVQQPPEGNDTAFTESDRQNPLTLQIGQPLTARQLTQVQLTSAPTKMITEQSATPVFETPVLNPGMVITNWRIPWIKMPMAGSSPMDQISSLQYADRLGFKLRFLYYHGMQPDDGGYKYPYASSDNLDIHGNQLRPFTLSLSPGAADYQSISYYYNYITNSKPAEFVFEMARATFMALRKNKRFIVRDLNNASVSALLDQASADFTNNKEQVVTKLTLYPRIMPDNLTEQLPPAPVYTAPPPYDNGVVYVRFNERNPHNYTSPIPPHYLTHQIDLYAEFFADSAGTIPKNVINLLVRYQTQNYLNGALLSSPITNVVCSSVLNTTTGNYEYELQADAGVDSTQGANYYEWVYALMASTGYTIIP